MFFKRVSIKKGTYNRINRNIFVENLRRFNDLDGKVALGNDYADGPGEFELGIPMYEIEKMAEAGMNPMQIIVASTMNAAVVSGIESEIGALQPRKIADVLVLDGNPLEDIQALTHIKMVIHLGKVIRNEGLLETGQPAP